MAHDGLSELFASIAAVGKDMSEPGKTKTHGLQHIDRPVAILDIGSMDVCIRRAPCELAPMLLTYEGSAWFRRGCIEGFRGLPL